MRLLITLSALFIFSLPGFSQNLDQEPEFIYRKATYLIETNRYDEAVQELNKIISTNPSYKDVLYQRAFAKFNLAAYSGAKKDLLSSFEVSGISPDAVALFGKTQKNMGDSEAAKQTMATADILFPNGSSPRKKSENRETPSSDGSDDSSDLKKIEEKISQILDDILPKKDSDSGPNDEPSNDPRKRTDENGTRTPTSDDNTQEPRDDGRIVIVEEPAEPVYVEDTSEKRIVIDEDLTLVIKNGLGGRDINNEPSILMLAQTSGEVVVDICVNSSGKVTAAEFNKDESSLSTQSLITLAVRKSKEFVFARSNQDEICGTIVFQITGSN